MQYNIGFRTFNHQQASFVYRQVLLSALLGLSSAAYWYWLLAVKFEVESKWALAVGSGLGFSTAYAVYGLVNRLKI